MPETKRDVVIIGGGHNGLVTAFYLAKAGFKPLVLERRAQVGGAAITDEFHPGFRCSTLAHTAGPIRADIVREMQLEKHGLRHCALARWPRAFSLSRRKQVRAGGCRVLAKRLR
jgi:phytoene dehydrogenase-like protein